MHFDVSSARRFSCTVVTVMEARGSGGDTRGDGDIDVRSIKRSIAYRAKYRKGQGESPLYKIFPPGLVVPPPPK